MFVHVSKDAVRTLRNSLRRMPMHTCLGQARPACSGYSPAAYLCISHMDCPESRSPFQYPPFPARGRNFSCRTLHTSDSGTRCTPASRTLLGNCSAVCRVRRLSSLHQKTCPLDTFCMLPQTCWPSTTCTACRPDTACTGGLQR